MRQDAEFRIPFPSRISSDVDGARERALRWARRHGLVTGPVDERRFVSWDLAGLMARWAPLATGAALDVVVDATIAMALLDDQFDGPLADQPAEVARACLPFRAVLRGEPAGASPLVVAFADAWAHVCAGRSAYWRAREAGHWCSYVDAYPEETLDRAAGVVLSRESYFAQRRRSGAVYPMIGMTESAYGFEISRRAYETSAMRRMFEIAADVIDTTNDVYSLAKEEPRGDTHNLVLVLERERGGPRAERVAEAVGLVNRWCAEFVETERRLDDFCAANHVETRSVWRLVDILRSAMRGHHDWYAHTSRYTSPSPAYTNLL